jgi:hypothetical protein
MNDIQSLIESSKYKSLAESDTATMKMMLENTEKEQTRLITEGTLAGDTNVFTPILMPMVRRVYPNLIANEILGVQPMSMPTGFIYALTNHYKGTQATPIANSAIILDVTAANGVDTVANVAYAVGDAITASGGATGTVAFVEGNKMLVTVTAGTFAFAETLTGFTAQGDDVVTVGGVYSNEAAFKHIFSNYTGSLTTAAAEALGTDMQEVGFSIDKKTVEAKSRALKGQYSVEMYQDLKSQHGLLADEEIMSLMSYEMQAEIDREVVDFVNGNATQLADSPLAVSAADGRWEIEKYRTQAIRISAEAAQIGLDTKRGQGNVLIVSPKVATMLEQVGSFKAAEQASTVSAPVSGGVAGTFDNKFKVVIDQYAASDYCTVMYKGADRRDAMGFFAPYVPMSFTKVTHADSGQPAVIAKTRYALDTIPGISSAASNDRAALYARSFGIDFTATQLA